MYIVYIIESIKNPGRVYIGYTENLSGRIREHNSKKSGYAGKYAPWEIRACIIFENKKKAKDFEKYLKSGSGFAFLKKRLI